MEVQNDGENMEKEPDRLTTMDKNPKPKKSCSEILKFAFRNVTIEPVLFLFITGISIHIVTVDNLLIEKVCLTIDKYSEEVCKHIEDQKYSDKIDHVQKHVATWKIIIGLSSAIPSIFYSIIVGSWSDKHGRKPFIVIPIIGLVIETVVYMVLAHSMESPVWLMILPQIIGTLFGGYGCFVCSLAYIVDVSTDKSRTIRIAILEGCAAVGIPLGIAIGGGVFKAYRYLGVFATSACIEVIAVLYAIFLLKESNTKLIASTMWQKIRDLFRVNNIVDSFKAFNAPRERRIKVIMITILFCQMVKTFAMEGKYIFSFNIIIHIINHI